MPDHHGPSTTAYESVLTHRNPGDELRLLSHPPHPYNRQPAELLDPPSSRAVRPIPLHTDSGTEADDEHFLKGLPAPRRLHKGLRGRDETSSGASTPCLAHSAPPGEEVRRLSFGGKKNTSWSHLSATPANKWREKRTREVVRRFTELLLICVLCLFVYSNVQVQPILHKSRRELRYAVGAAAAVIILYPLRLLLWAHWHRNPARKLPIEVPSSFDPAPLLYPPTMTLLVSSLIAVDNAAVFLPNIILALCSLPRALMPTLSPVDENIDALHWLLASAPLALPRILDDIAMMPAEVESSATLPTPLSTESVILLYPLHCSLLRVLHSLTTTSLLTTELQLLSVGLINILLLSSSPQVTILKAMLWVGGLDILVSCSKPIQWGVALARVPKWRFKRPSNPVKREPGFISTLMSWRQMRHDLFHTPSDSSSCSSCEVIDDTNDTDDPSGWLPRGIARVRVADADAAGVPSVLDGEGRSSPSIDNIQENKAETVQARRHTLPTTGPQRKLATHTPSGRKKRSASLSIKAFVSLTYKQAVYRKWIYALYVYICVVGWVFIPHPTVGVKEVVKHESLRGDEPVGWALGYLFGDIQCFRWEVLIHNLGWWICLPPRLSQDTGRTVENGWVEHSRYSFGEANTRLLLSAYCIVIIAAGLLVVSRLSPICEVDTRRKVFHFMMVAMFLPATYIDPCYVALALSIVLAAFLLLDLLRASQLPPLSKPLATFLAPYVDGRDLRGPVVISHIFLLIGCAIPLWLSLGSLPRIGYGHLQGWGVATREVAMVSGVVCVGLGDAAASLIGRRYGRRKWLWGGGKSLEGSAAFASAVFLGLMAAHTWLRLGGWAATNRNADTWQTTIQKTGACAGIASLTEAVLTGGNDNVIVPVVLWACVKSLGV